jgi:hypothetical protein
MTIQTDALDAQYIPANDTAWFPYGPAGCEVLSSGAHTPKTGIGGRFEVSARIDYDATPDVQRKTALVIRPANASSNVLPGMMRTGGRAVRDSRCTRYGIAPFARIQWSAALVPRPPEITMPTFWAAGRLCRMVAIVGL